MRVLSALAVSSALLVSAASAQQSEAVWMSGTFPSENGTGESAYLTFGIPETDAIAFNASCESGVQGPSIPVMLLVDFGDRPNGTPMNVDFLTAGFSAEYAGVVEIASSEYAGIALNIGIEDPLWSVLSRNRQIAFGGAGLPKINIPLTGSAPEVGKFLAACRANFAAYDANVTPTISVVDYQCDDGTSLRVGYDNSRSYTVALITYGSMVDMPLVQAISGSGERYSNGDTTLHSKGPNAFFQTGSTERNCTEK